MLELETSETPWRPQPEVGWVFWISLDQSYMLTVESSRPSQETSDAENPKNHRNPQTTIIIYLDSSSKTEQ